MMSSLLNNLRANRFVVMIMAIYVILCLLQLPRFQWIVNADVLAFVVAAENTIEGSLTFIIADFWGPLLSWLMVPLLMFDFSGFVAAKLVAIFAGAGTLFFGFRLLRVITDTESNTAMYTAALVPLVLYWALATNAFADLLTLATLVGYFYYLLLHTRLPKKNGKVLPVLFALLSLLSSASVLPVLFSGLLAHLYFSRSPLVSKKSSPVLKGTVTARIIGFFFVALVLIVVYPRLEEAVDKGKPLGVAAETILSQQADIIHTNVASNKSWEDSHTLSYLVEAQYVGEFMSLPGRTDLKYRLKSENIDYFFLWQEDRTPLYLDSYYEVMDIESLNLRIFKETENLLDVY